MLMRMAFSLGDCGDHDGDGDAGANARGDQDDVGDCD